MNCKHCEMKRPAHPLLPGRWPLALAAAIALMLGANVATADLVIWDTSWMGQTGVTAGSFQDPLNWPDDKVADSLCNVTLNLPCDTTEIHFGDYGGFAGGLNTVNSMGLPSGNWTFDLDGGTGSLTMLDRLALASSDGQDAHLTIQGGGTVITTSMVHLSNGSDIPGSTANSSITITGSGTSWEAQDYIDLGWNGTGAVYVKDSAFWSLSGNANIGIGEGSQGILEINGGATAQLGLIALGRDGATSDGRILVSGSGSSLNVDDAIHVGQNGTGLLQVGDSAQVVANGGLVVGGQRFSGTGEGDPPFTGVGTVHISGKGSITANAVLVESIVTESSILVTGAESQLHSTGLMDIGIAGGAGRVDAEESGKINIDGDLTIGKGGLYLSGASNLFVGGGALLLRGGQDVSSLNIQDSSVNSYAELIMGSDSGSGRSVVDIAGASRFEINAIDRNLYVGQLGNGELTIRDGASMLVVQGWAYVGLEASSTGVMSVTGSDSIFTLELGPLTVGGDGNGTLSVNNGGTVLINDGELWVGTGSDSQSAAVLVSGGTLTEQSAYASVIGLAGQGELTVENGGQVSLSHTHIGGDWIGSSTGNGTVTVRNSGSSLTTNSMVVGFSGSGTLLVENAGLVNVTGPLSVAWGDGSVGAVTVQGGGQIDVGEAAHIGGDFGGSGGTATLDVLDGGQMTVQGQMMVGISAGGNGTVQVSGSGSTLNVNGNGGEGNVVGMELGLNDGIGTLSVLDGGRVNVTWAFTVGGNTTGEGQATVDGPDSVLEIGREMIVGREAKGTLNIQNGGSVNLTGATDEYDVIMIGGAVEGTINVTGAESSLVGGQIQLGVGTTGIGTLNVENGAFVIGNHQSAIGYSGQGSLNIDRSVMTSFKTGSSTNTSAILGRYADAIGQATLTNNSGWNHDGTVNVGWFGSGELNVFSGSRVESMDGIIGRMAGSSGTVLIQQTQAQDDGYNANWSIHHNLSVGGTMDAEGGAGRLTVDGACAFMSVGFDEGIGGTLRVWQKGEVNLANGGRIAVGSAAYGAGGWLVVDKGGTVDLHGGKITGAGVRVRSGGVMAGSGNIAGDVIINSGGLLSPGHSPGTLSIGTAEVPSSVTMAANSIYEWEFDGTAADKVVVTGSLTLTSGWDLALVDAGGTPAIGSKYDLFTYTTTFSGSITGDIIASPVTWPTARIFQDPTAKKIYVQFGWLGDANEDGVVDAADYIALKRNFGMTGGATWAQGNFNGGVGTVDWVDLQILMANFGTRSVDGAPPVPEPATLSLLALGGLAMLRRRRK